VRSGQVRARLGGVARRRPARFPRLHANTQGTVYTLYTNTLTPHSLLNSDTYTQWVTTYTQLSDIPEPEQCTSYHKVVLKENKKCGPRNFGKGIIISHVRVSRKFHQGWFSAIWLHRRQPARHNHDLQSELSARTQVTTRQGQVQNRQTSYVTRATRLLSGRNTGHKPGMVKCHKCH